MIQKQNTKLQFEEHLATESNSVVGEFLDHIGILLAKEYAERMELASQESEKVLKLER